MLRFAFGILSAALLSGCVTDTQDRDYRSDWSRYDYDRPDPSYGKYYADRYHRDDPRRYREHQLKRNERVYRYPSGEGRRVMRTGA